MRLVRLSVEHFQCIRSADLDFGRGLNVLYGPNDLGKSSLAWAIRAVLLLQHNAAAHERFVSWYGDGEPRVALTLCDDEDRYWRVTKTFGGAGSGRSHLESSKDGRTFITEVSGRQVDDRLRTMLRWGIQRPGGQGPRGFPTSFLTQVLLAEQDNVPQVLFDGSLVKDPDESGRLRLTEALNVLAQDPLFKKVLDAAQARVDVAFTPTGQQRRGKGSPFVEISDQLNLMAARARRAGGEGPRDGRRRGAGAPGQPSSATSSSTSWRKPAPRSPRRRPGWPRASGATPSGPSWRFASPPSGRSRTCSARSSPWRRRRRGWRPPSPAGEAALTGGHQRRSAERGRARHGPQAPGRAGPRGRRGGPAAARPRESGRRPPRRPSTRPSDRWSGPAEALRLAREAAAAVAQASGLARTAASESAAADEAVARAAAEVARAEKEVEAARGRLQALTSDDRARTRERQRAELDNRRLTLEARRASAAQGAGGRRRGRPGAAAADAAEAKRDALREQLAGAEAALAKLEAGAGRADRRARASAPGRAPRAGPAGARGAGGRGADRRGRGGGSRPGGRPARPGRGAAGGGAPRAARRRPRSRRCGRCATSCGWPRPAWAGGCR